MLDKLCAKRSHNIKELNNKICYCSLACTYKSGGTLNSNVLNIRIDILMILKTLFWN